MQIDQDGNRLTIESAQRKALLDILRGLEPLESDDCFPDDVDSRLPPSKLVNL